jgi:hypothetical protein
VAAAASDRSRKTFPPEEHAPIEPFLPRETASAAEDVRNTCLAIDTANSLREVRNALLGDRLGDASRTAGGGEMGPAQGAEVTPHVPRAPSVGEDTRREPAVRGVSSARRAALAVPLLVTVVAIAWQVWVSHVGVGRPQAPADGPRRERTALQRVADGAQEAAARVDPAGDGQRLDAAVVPPDVHELRGEALTVRLRAHRVCWIRATADGRMVREGLLQGDEELVVKAREAILLRIGDAGALSVIVNGRAARSLGSDGQVVALRITRADYENLIAQELPRVSSMSGSVRMPQPVRIPPSGAPATDTSAEGLSEPAPGG